MLHFRFEHEFDLDPKPYWDMFFEDTYNNELFPVLKIKRTILEHKDEGGTIRRAVKCLPEKEVPAMFKSVVNDMSYTERDVFHKDRSEMEVVIEPALMKNKFDLKAIYSVRQAGPGKCKRIFEGDVKVSVMLIGGKIETFMVDEMRASYETTTIFTRKFIAKMAAAKKDAPVV